MLRSFAYKFLFYLLFKSKLFFLVKVIFNVFLELVEFFPVLGFKTAVIVIAGKHFRVFFSIIREEVRNLLT
jgi:hypothetical protein